MEQLLSHAQSFRERGLVRSKSEEIETCSHEGVQQKIYDIQSGREKMKTMINMKRMKPFLTAMEHLEKVLTTLDMQHSADVMSCVWGPVFFLLETTNITDKAFDCILDAYEKFGSRIPALIEYTRYFKLWPESLVYIYEDILKFHTLTCELFSLRAELWNKLYLPIWKSWEITFDHLNQSLKMHKDFIENHGSRFRDENATLTDIGRPEYMDCDPDILEHQKMRSGVNMYCSEVNRGRVRFAEDEKERKKREQKRVLAWISASEKTVSLHEQFQKKRTCPGTGRWLFKRYSEVTDWMTEDMQPEFAIWLQGSKGFGKSVLASLLIDELEKLKSEGRDGKIPPESKIYYFYCLDDPQHNNFLDILRGILHQMVVAEEYILPLCVAKCEYTGGNTILESETVAMSLIEPFFEYNSRQYVVIDGLDECKTADERHQAAKFFMEQAKKCESIKQGQLRILFMSEPMSDLTLKEFMPEDGACVKFTARDNAEDIKAYVKMRVKDLSAPGATGGGFNLSSDIKDHIESIVCVQSKAAEEMFLYACLAIDYLASQITTGQLIRNIYTEILPKKLKDMYEKLLGAVKDKLLSLFPDNGEDHWEMARSLLSWLVCAKRPLDWHEMQAILSYDPITQTVDFDNEMVRHDARNYMGSLVHIVDNEHVRIVHSTARSFLINNKHIDKMAVQCELTTRCLRYLCLLSSSRADDDETRKKKAMKGWFSFQDYACSQWQNHVDTLLKECKDLFVDNNGCPLENKWTREFGTALQEFVSLHREDLNTETHPDLPTPADLAGLTRLSYYDDLCLVWTHIYWHQREEYDNLNKVSISSIEEALQKNRAAIETLKPEMSAHRSDKVADYYGKNLFKCERVFCRFFYMGYNSASSRNAHVDRHKRPHPCPISGCRYAPMGFVKQKDCVRHVRVYHPEEHEGPSTFTALQRKRGEQNFECKMCDRKFTRKINLNGHERSHFGARPYECTSNCGKSFARLHDRKRHEMIHQRERRERMARF